MRFFKNICGILFTAFATAICITFIGTSPTQAQHIPRLPPVCTQSVEGASECGKVLAPCMEKYAGLQGLGSLQPADPRYDDLVVQCILDAIPKSHRSHLPADGGAQQSDLIGRCEHSEGDAQIAACTKLIDVADDADGKSVGHGFRGVAYGTKDRYQEALRDLNESLRLSSYDEGWVAAIRTERGLIYNSLNEFNAASADFTYAISVRSIDTRHRRLAYMGLAAMHAGMKEWNLSIDDASAYLVRYPQDAEMLRFRGNLEATVASFQKTPSAETARLLAASKRDLDQAKVLDSGANQ